MPAYATQSVPKQAQGNPQQQKQPKQEAPKGLAALPQGAGVAALAIVAVVAVAAVGFAGHMIAHHVGGFYARIEEEDERTRMEEEQAAKNAAQEENHQKGETQ